MIPLRELVMGQRPRATAVGSPTTVTAGSAALSPWLLLALPGALAFALYAPVIPGLVADWTAFPSLSHGFAIPFIAAYLIWARRARLAPLTLTPSAAGLPILLAGLGVLLLGRLGEEPFVARLSLPLMLLGLAWFLGGWDVVRQTWIGLVYLFFMIPPPFSTLKLVTFQSRLLDTAVSASLLARLGVPVWRDGVFLHLPNVVLEVADACSSIPVIAALLSLGVAYAALTPRPVAIRVALVVAALPLAITANIIRIVSVAALVYYVGTWTLKTAYHMFNGTVNFLFTLLLLLALDSLLMRMVRSWRR